MSDHWEKVKEELTCAICHDLLTDPKILPCLHSFCLSCVKQVVAKASSDESSVTVKCPVCRAEVALSTSGALEELLSHFTAARLVEIIRMQELAGSEKTAKQQCGECDEEEDVAASCSDCAIFLCASCYPSHQRRKATKRHKIVTMKELKKGACEIPSVLPERMEMCPLHPTKQLDMYCKCEEVLICSSCTVKKHKDHDYDVISDAVEEEKKILKAAIPGMDQLIAEVETAIKGVKKMRRQQNERKNANLTRLNEAIRTLQAALEQTRKQLEEEVEGDSEGRDKALGIQEEELTFLLGSLTSCRDFFLDKTSHGVNHDVLALKRKMLGRKDHLIVERSKAKMDPVSKPRELINLAEKIMSIFGGIVEELLPTIVQVTAENTHALFESGKENSFSVSLNDLTGNGQCAKKLDVKVEHFKTHCSEAATVSEIEGGRYEVSYKPRAGGVHVASVMVEGEPVSGSPFKVIAVMREYQGMGQQNCQLVNKYGEKNFSRPYNVCVGANDEIIVQDNGNQEVVVFDKNMNYVRSFGHDNGKEDVLGDGEDQYIGEEEDEPVTAYIGDAEDQCWSNIVEEADEPVTAYIGDAEDQYIGEEADEPVTVYIGDGEDQDIGEEAAESVTVGDAEDRDDREGELDNPYGVAVCDDVIAVSDWGDHVVKKFSIQGKYLAKIGSRGNGEGQFSNPQGLAFNSKGLLFVVDSSNHRVQCFDGDNKFVMMFGSRGSGPGQFLAPRYIAVNSQEQLYITDWSGNKCINIYSEEGQFITKIACDDEPYAVAIGPDDYILTSCWNKNCLTVYSSFGELITQFGTRGDKRGQFNGIYGIAVTNSGTVVVGEYSNSRIQLIK